MKDFFDKQLHVSDLIIIKYNSPKESFRICKILHFSNKVESGEEGKTLVAMVIKNVEDINKVTGNKVRIYPKDCIKVSFFDVMNKFEKIN